MIGRLDRIMGGSFPAKGLLNPRARFMGFAQGFLFFSSSSSSSSSLVDRFVQSLSFPQVATTSRVYELTLTKIVLLFSLSTRGTLTTIMSILF